MNIKNLHFFDDKGYSLNFYWDENYNCWTGNLYLPPVSVGLYSNTSIFILERLKDSQNNDIFVYPRYEKGKPSVLTCRWDMLNTFVDEFFLFTFDETYQIKETSSLVYTPQDGPTGKVVLKTFKEVYAINLDDTEITSTYSDFAPQKGENQMYNMYDYDKTPFRVLPIHVGFTAPSHHNSSTYNRTLVISYGSETVARITFYIETVEEDERLKIWNHNLGYNIQPKDTIIFKHSSLKEPKPDFILLNEKRKELMIEGHNIYPYVGTYKAIINALKFFGYNNLNIVELWRNINPDDYDNFGKLYHASKYSLNKEETISYGNKNIPLPSKNFKKTHKLALTYNFNHPIRDWDRYELPLINEDFDYTIEEAVIKLYALKNKLNSEFMPGSSKIIDIIGEGNYFGLNAIKHNVLFGSQTHIKGGIKLNINTHPDRTIHITRNKYFHDFIFNDKNKYSDDDDDKDIRYNNILDDLVYISELYKYKDYILQDSNIHDLKLSETEICQYYKDYFNLLHNSRYLSEYTEDDLFDTIKEKTNELLIGSVPENWEANSILSDDWEHLDPMDKIKTDDSDVDYESNSLIYENEKSILENSTKLQEPNYNILSDNEKYKYLIDSISAKVILENTSLDELTFGGTNNNFKYYSTATFGSITYSEFNKIDWSITMSENQIDESDAMMNAEGGYSYPIPEVTDDTDSFVQSSRVVAGYYVYSTETNKWVKKYRPDNWSSDYIYDIENMSDTQIYNLYIYQSTPFDYFDDILPDEIAENLNKELDNFDPSTKENDPSFSEGLPFIVKIYFNNIKKRFAITKSGELSTYNKIFVELPFLGYYDVQLTLTDKYNNISSRIFPKHIKVEPYQIDIRGFYYDARKLPEYLNYEFNEPDEQGKYSSKENEYERTIINTLRDLTAWAVQEHTYQHGYDETMPNFDKDGNYMNVGPYAFENMTKEWYLVDNISWELSKLIPNIKYARYIHSGVDVKPLTWILLGYDKTKIAGKCEPIWTLTNNTTGKSVIHKGKYLTCLLKEDGFYTVTLELKDYKGNSYSKSQNLIVVNKTANHKLYHTLKQEYDNEQEVLKYYENLWYQDELVTQYFGYYGYGDIY